MTSAIGFAVSLLPEHSSQLLWEPIISRAKKSLDLFMNIIKNSSLKDGINGLARLGGECFHPDFFCYMFTSLRAASDVTRNSQATSSMYEILTELQLKARDLLNECDSNITNDRLIVIHPKIRQLLIYITIQDE